MSVAPTVKPRRHGEHSAAEPERARPARARKSLWRRIVEQRAVYAMLLPNVLMFLIFAIYPLLWALRYMFFSYDGLSAPRFVGLDNFVRVFTRDTIFWAAVGNTFTFAVGKLALTLPIALVLAVILNGKLRARGLLRAVYFMPTIMGAAVMSMVFFLIFNPYNGSLNQLLQQIDAVEKPVDWLGVGSAMLTVIVVAAWGGIGNYMVLFLAGLQTIPAELYESAQLDGASRPRMFFSITLPLLGPVLKIVLLLAIINALKGYESIMVLTGGGPGDTTQVMYLYVYQLFFPISVGGQGYTPQFGYGSAVGIVASLIIGAITALYLWSARKLDRID